MDILNYAFHFLGPLVITFSLYYYFFNLRTSAFIGMSYAIVWEVAQFEGWWNALGYKWNILNKYYWLDTSIDLALSLIAVILVIYAMRSLREF